MFIKLLNFIITKIEPHSKGLQQELFRNILNSIDSYNKNNYGTLTFRYYRFVEFKEKIEPTEHKEASL